RNSKITTKGMSVLSGLVNLSKLDLERCTGIHGGLAHLKGLKKLEALNINCCNCITDVDMKPLSELTNLKELQISCSKVTDHGVTFLKGLHKLALLNMERCPVTSACLDSLSGLHKAMIFLISSLLLDPYQMALWGKERQRKIACIEEIAKDAKLIEIDDQLLLLIKRQVETELMLDEKFRYQCEEVSNFVKEFKDVVNEVERLSCKDITKETVHLFRRGQKHELHKMTCLQMMVNESHLSVCEKHTFVRKMNFGTLD
nr:hypothetical protein [Tanacetum cinerariifolium]